MKFYESEEGNACTYCGGIQSEPFEIGDGKAYEATKNNTKGKNVMTNWRNKNQNYMGNIGYGVTNVQPATQPYQAKEECWEVEVDKVADCSKAPADIVVWIKPLAKVKIDALMEKYPNLEWFAYLLSDDPEKEPHIVADIHIPKQYATAGNVDDIECDDFNDLPCIGAIHSHHGMGTGFSGTDHEWVNQNHDISLVIAKNGIAGQVRWKTPCGSLKIIDAKIKPLFEVEFDKEAFLKETEKISNTKKLVPRQPATTGGGNLNESQKSYVNGKSPKENTTTTNENQNDQNGKSGKEKSDGGNSDDDGESGVWDLDKENTQTTDDNQPVDPDDQSLESALTEAFGE
jgi:hypothetical protein